MVVIFHKKLKDLRNRASKAIFVETRGLLRGFELSLTDRFPFEYFFFFMSFFRFECDQSQIWTDQVQNITSSMCLSMYFQIREFQMKNNVCSIDCANPWFPSAQQIFSNKNMFAPQMAPPIQQPRYLTKGSYCQFFSCNIYPEPVLLL